MSRPRILVFDQLYRVLAERIVEFQAEQRPRWSRVDLRVRLAYRRLGRLARRRGGGGGASRVAGGAAAGGGSGGRRYGVGLGRRRRRVSRHLGILASSRSSDYTCWLLGLHITTGQSINQSINQSVRTSINTASLQKYSQKRPRRVICARRNSLVESGRAM